MREAVKARDRYGLPISTSSAAAADHYVEGIDLLLSQSYGPEERFQQAIEADDGFALAHGAMAAVLMFRVRPVEAKESVERASSLAAGTAHRERQQVEAIRLFVNGEGPRALALIREHLSEYPRDVLMLRLGHRLYLLGCNGAGVADYPQPLLEFMKSVEPAYGDDWAFLGQYSFAHHENGLLEEARRLAERSLTLRPSNAVASHSVAHVFFESGEHSGGADFLGDWISGYDKRAPFHVHLSWHLALFELAEGHYQRALELYEHDIRPSVVEKSPTSLADSASLMWRTQMYSGSAPPFPWQEVQEQAAPAAHASKEAAIRTRCLLARSGAG